MDCYCEMGGVGALDKVRDKPFGVDDISIVCNICLLMGAVV